MTATTPSERQRAIAIAMYSRRFVLIGVTKEYQAAGEVRRAALDAEMGNLFWDMGAGGGIGLSELVGVSCAGPVDAACADAYVALKDASPYQSPDMREFLSTVSEDRALGVWYCLHADVRRIILARRAEWRELVDRGPAAELVKQAGWDLADADGLGVSAWTRANAFWILSQDPEDTHNAQARL